MQVEVRTSVDATSPCSVEHRRWPDTGARTGGSHGGASPLGGGRKRERVPHRELSGGVMSRRAERFRLRADVRYFTGGERVPDHWRVDGGSLSAACDDGSDASYRARQHVQASRGGPHVDRQRGQ